METTLDGALGGRLRLRQPAKGYRFAIDAVLLAACCPAEPGQRVLELGCGIGTAALAIARLRPGVACVGIDKQPALIDLANANARENGLSDRVAFKVADVRRADDVLGPDAFDHVIANPPHLRRSASSVSRDPLKAAATHEDEGGLEAWIEAASRCLRDGGRALFIHRADRLAELLWRFQGRFGAIQVLPLLPRAASPAGRVVMAGRKGSRAPLSLLAGLALHEADGGWTEVARAVLEGRRSLDLDGASPATIDAPRRDR